MVVQCYENPVSMRWYQVHADCIASILKDAYHFQPQCEVIIQQSLLSLIMQVHRSVERAWHKKNHKTIPTLPCPILHLQGILDSHLTLNMVAVATFQTMTVSSSQNRIHFFNNPSKFIPSLEQHSSTSGHKCCSVEI